MLFPDQHAEAVSVFLCERLSDETRLRLVRRDDAAFILSLRNDPEKGRNLSQTDASLAAQEAWLDSYERRRSASRELYFIIEHGAERIGTVRLYDYRLHADSFCWGSWIISAGAPTVSAYRSAILVYDLAFGPLGFSRAHFDVRQANQSVWRFHERMGSRLESEDELDRFYIYEYDSYLARREELKRYDQGRPWVTGEPKICIAGKNDIAADCLDKLLADGFAPSELCVVGNRNDPGRHTWQRSLLAAARSKGVRIWPIERVQELPGVRFFSLEHDRILRPARFRSPHLYNLHFSKLPAYRGVATSVWPLVHQEAESGVTLHCIDEGVDTGPIVASRSFALTSGMVASDLYQAYTRHGVALFAEHYPALLVDQPRSSAQDLTSGSYYPRSSIDYARIPIDFTAPAPEVLAILGGFTFWQYQLPTVGGRRVWQADHAASASPLAPGAVRDIDDWTSDVGTGTSPLRLTFCALDQIIDWARGAGAPKSFPAVLPDLDVEDVNGWTPLMVAAHHGSLGAAEWLLLAGAHLDHQNRRGTNALMYAQSQAQLTGDLAMVRMLSAAGADKCLRDQHGLAAIDYCDQLKYPELWQLLRP
jgi:methionyl-tRNA formyltransferase